MAKMMTTRSGQALSVFCGNDYLDSTQRNNLVSTLYIAFGSVSFPEKNWYDFPLILDWWLHELKEFRQGNQPTAVLRFMDGPFRVEISRKSTAVIAKFYRDDQNLTPELTGQAELEIDLPGTERNLIEVAQQAVRDAEAANAGDNEGIKSIRISLDETLKSFGAKYH
jgi:hypothetical protein